jgi:O-antigen chain-terminating methyltransferase
VPAVDYRSFEDLMRGSEEEIAGRQAQYVPVFEGLQDVLDVGCGRGEFLTLLSEHGIRARGADRDHEMAERCRELGLDVTEGDALPLLAALPPDSLGGVFAGQVVEHMEPAALVAFLDAARRAVRPGAARLRRHFQHSATPRACERR